jgi:hypothetical protein
LTVTRSGVLGNVNGLTLVDVYDQDHGATETRNTLIIKINN